MDVFIASTMTAGLTPLGPANQRSLVLLGDVLRDRLGADHASLFADPVPGEFGDRFDWYAPQGGVPVALARLSEAERTALWDKVSSLCADILALGETLRTSPDPQERSLGDALANAVEIPGEESVYALRDATTGTLSPIVINWGWVRSEERAVRGVLTGRAATTRAPRTLPAAGLAAATPVQASAAPAAAAAPWRIWPWLLMLGWLLLALILGLILWLLIYPCGLMPGRIAYHCPTPVVTQADPLAADRLVLEDQIAALERELAAQDRMCQPVAAPAPPQTAPPQEAAPPAPDQPQDELDARLQDRGGQLGDLNFALFWNSVDDIDIHVTCPSGEQINYIAPSGCGGTLDVDANVGGDRLNDPVENIFFSDPLPGTYEVRVHLYSNRTAGPKPFTLRVRQSDGTMQDFSGVVSPSAPDWRQSITVGN